MYSMECKRVTLIFFMHEACRRLLLELESRLFFMHEACRLILEMCFLVHEAWRLQLGLPCNIHITCDMQHIHHVIYYYQYISNIALSN